MAKRSSEFLLSERTACKLLERSGRVMGMNEAGPQREVARRVVKLARQKPRYGYRRLYALLSRRGQELNVERVYRLYVEER